MKLYIVRIDSCGCQNDISTRVKINNKCKFQINILLSRPGKNSKKPGDVPLKLKIPCY